MANITAADVAKLRKITNAGMMDCKKALGEAEGDFDKAIEYLRKKGQKLASKREDNEATEGVILSAVTADKKQGAIISLNCETDFVAKNDDFVAFVKSILDLAIENKPADLDALKALELNGMPLAEAIIEQVGKVGEKLDLSAYELVSGEEVVAYIHPGNRLATLVAFNESLADEQVGKDVAMQVAAMNPVSLAKEDCPQDVIEKEIEIAKEQLRNEGKPEAMLEKIAQGKLNKFFKEQTLLEQAFIKDNKTSVKQYLQAASKGLTAVAFKRFSL